MSKLTRRELIEEVVRHGGLTARAADLVVDKIIRRIFSSLAEGHGVELRGLGSFVHVVCQPRVGRNPLEPEKDIIIPRRYKLKFNPGRDLRARLLKLSAELAEAPKAEAKKSGSATKAGSAKKETAAKSAGRGKK